MGRRLKAELHVPIVCWLQDEHVWANAMRPDESARVWQVLRERAAEMDGLVAVSRHYAGQMAALLALDPGRVRAIHIGVDPEAYGTADLQGNPRTVGFVSRLAEGEGFGAFVDAFIELHRDPRFADVRLKATGGPHDSPFVRQQVWRLRAAGLAHLSEIVPDAFQNDRPAFLRTLTLLSVPAPQGEAFGTYLVEAMAAGVPVVQPAVGAYPEVLAEAGCGQLSAGTDAVSLARAWAELLADPARMADEARRGRAAVARHFNLDRMARETVAFYEELRGRMGTVGTGTPT